MYPFLLVRIGHVTLQWQTNPEIPVTWCLRLTVYPTLHVCAGGEGGGCREGRRGSSAVPQGPQLTEAPRPGHHPMRRQACKSLENGDHGYLTVSAWEFLRSLLLWFHWPECHGTLQNFKWEGWSGVSRVPRKDRRRHPQSSMCITHHTSDLASPILEVIVSKSSEKFKKMLEQRISSYPWPWP